MTGTHDAAGVWHEPFEVPFRDTDREGHVKRSVWLAWLAELAGDDYEARGAGRDALIRQGQVFLIRQFALQVYRAPALYDTLEARTWEHGTQAVFFRRHYAFDTPDGARAADARSTWLLCDPVNHRILRPKALAEPVRNIDAPNDCPDPSDLILPEEAPVLGERKILFTDLDANRHVYCANYGNIIMDHLPETYVRHPFSFFEITYVKEALAGETLTLRGMDTPEGFIMAGLHTDGSVSFISKMRL